MPVSNNFIKKMPEPTHGSKIFCPFLISPNLDTIYSAVLGGVITTPNSFLLYSIGNQHSENLYI